jgi:signal transduction histidine kinase
MKKRKSFSRFLLWILIILEGLSLAVVIGFLYAMLDRVITREYHHQIETQVVEIQNLLIRRSDLVRARIDEISANNGVGVSLLLGMFDKAEELMQQSYPPAGGALFYLRHPSGKIVPLPTDDYSFVNRLTIDVSERLKPARLLINPTMIAFARSVQRNGEILGQAIGVYDIAADPAVAETLEGYQNVRLVAHIDDRYMDLGSSQTNWSTKDSSNILRKITHAGIKQAYQHARLPVETFTNLFVVASDAQLVQKRWNLIIFLILLCLPLFGLTLTVSFLIFKKVTSSINALAENAMAIADASSPQDLDEQRVQHEEFLHLAQAFNKVLSKVRRRTRELRRHQRHLDKLVEERTAELHASNQKLKQTQAKMIQAEKMASIGQLAAGVAHEINNPIGFINSNLYTIKGYCQEMKELLARYEKLESVIGADAEGHASIHDMLENIRQYKETIEYDYIKEELDCVLDESKTGVERVAGIVRDLKDFSHDDPVEVEYVDINEGIESTLNIVRNQLDDAATVNKDLGKLPMVKCDLEQMNQVFMNLLINAGQSIERNGVIDIRTRCVENLVEIVIKDNGCGIPPDIKSKIFDPFFTTKEVGNGTGLGLNLVYNIVKSHNGSIDVESEVGIGTTFTVRLDIDGRQVQR